MLRSTFLLLLPFKYIIPLWGIVVQFVYLQGCVARSYLQVIKNDKNMPLCLRREGPLESLNALSRGKLDW